MNQYQKLSKETKEKIIKKAVRKSNEEQAKIMKHDCHKNIKRLGRANYQCNICKRDMSLELFLLYETLGNEEFNKLIEEV